MQSVFSLKAHTLIWCPKVVAHGDNVFDVLLTDIFQRSRLIFYPSCYKKESSNMLSSYEFFPCKAANWSSHYGKFETLHSSFEVLIAN